MNILVTGGAGFIGSHVVDAYLAEGHRVVVIDDLSTGVRDNVNAKAEFYHIDIRSDEVDAVFARHRFDVVNHHAAQMDVRRSVADPQFDASVNVLGGINILEAARRHRVRKIVFASTGGAIYGEQEYFPADENHACRPLSPYGITKLTTERYLFYYKEIHGMDSIVLRYANVYGPRQNPHGEAGVVAIFVGKMLNGEQPVINGDGLQTRDYTYVEDVARANVLSLEYRGSAIFNVGTGIETNVLKLFRALCKHTGVEVSERHGPARAGEQRRSVVSYERIRNELGWTPEVSLDEGLRRTVEFFRKKLG